MRVCTSSPCSGQRTMPMLASMNAVSHERAVRQVGDRVVQRLVLEGLLDPLPFGDVAVPDDDAALCRAQRLDRQLVPPPLVVALEREFEAERGPLVREDGLDARRG